MRVLLFLLGVLLLLVPEVLRVYYIMPFPGSQENTATDLHQVDMAYWLHTHIWWIRLLGLAALLGPFVYYLKRGGVWKRIAVLVPTALCALVFYAFNFKFMADTMFYPPKEKHLTPVPTTEDMGALPDSTANQLVIAVERNGDARAYPIELIGYHHQVLDTIGGEPVLITYCTVCRTGRAWKPEVNGQPETFRLVGMDHFNAMFEDSRTKSWWRQVTGECIEGPLKGHQLEEVPSEQVSLGEFAARHPKGLVFQPDPHFAAQYAGLRGYDDGTIASSLEYRDTASWQPKSWVVGVVHNGQARAYDWNELRKERLVIDTLGHDSLWICARMHSCLVWNLCAMRPMTEAETHYEPSLIVDDCSNPPIELLDSATTLIARAVPVYQEFWHSWRTFHPNTTRYEAKK